MITSYWKNTFVQNVSVALLAIVLAGAAMPSYAQAATIFSDSFGTGSDDTSFNEAPAWTEGGAGAEKRASGSGNDSASANGGRFATIFGTNGGSKGYICTTVNATGYTNLMLSYFWRGDSDSNNPSDDGLVQYKTSGNCTSGSWTTLKNHDLQSDAIWTEQSAFSVPVSNASFLLRFYTDSNQDDEHFRVDGVLVDGTAVVANQVPVASNQSVSTDEDVAVGITLGATDGDSDPLTYTVVTGPTHGSLSGTAPALTYTPDADYFGSDSFTFKANDGEADSNTATVSITVNSVDEPITPAEQCVLDGGTWVEGSCDFPPTPEEQCELDGGTWVEGSCDLPATPEEQCELDGGTWVEGSCDFPPTPEEQCELDGGTWVEGNCDMPMTPEEECIENGGVWDSELSTCESSEPTPEEQCVLDGGTWVEGNCDMPELSEQEQCELDGGVWTTEGDFSFCVPAEEEEEDDNKANRTNHNMGGSRGGSVLGASTEACEALITTYMGPGQENNADEVTKLQGFLNDKESAGIPVTGSYDEATVGAVKAFQVKYWEEVLKPWFGIPGSGVESENDATGFVYKTTQRMVNNIHCPSLELPMPQLP